MLWPASAAGQCARLGSLNGRPNTRVIVPGFLPELFVVRCALRHIAMEKGNQLSTVDTFFGKSSEVIAPTEDAADEFNVDAEPEEGPPAPPGRGGAHACSGASCCVRERRSAWA